MASPHRRTGAAFVLVERRHPHPLLPPRLFRAGRVSVGSALMALLGSVWIALFFFPPLYRQQVLGSSPLAAGLGQLPLAAANMLGSTLAPRISCRFGAIPTVTVALLTEAAGLLWCRARYQYVVSFLNQEGYGGCCIVKYDRGTGARHVHQVGDARLHSEAVFVPGAGATGEDDGYLLTVVSDLQQNASQLLVLDASGLGRIATVHLPRRVTGGIHGSWIPDSDLDATES
nr:carotenoid oxygenase family protein [Streptomyces sp. NBC_00886]